VGSNPTATATVTSSFTGRDEHQEGACHDGRRARIFRFTRGERTARWITTKPPYNAAAIASGTSAEVAAVVAGVDESEDRSGGRQCRGCCHRQVDPVWRAVRAMPADDRRQGGETASPMGTLM